MITWVNDERTVLVMQYDENEPGVLHVATRPEPGATWGPPIKVKKETS